MYIADFARNMMRKANIPILIYLLLNILFIAALLGVMGVSSTVLALLWAVVLYVASAAVALSPVGEFVLRRQVGCRAVKDEAVLNRIMPLFRQAMEQARQGNVNIPADVRLYINDEPEANAFATGRKTICITRGLLVLPDNQILAVLGHELGHLAHHDTDLILLISVGNFFIAAWFVGVQVVAAILRLIFSIVGLVAGGTEGFIASFGSAIAHLMLAVGVSLIMWIWTKLGIYLVMKSSKENEFEADQFSADMGYGQALCDFFAEPYVVPKKGLFANLISSHPENNARIARIQAILNQKASVQEGAKEKVGLL